MRHQGWNHAGCILASLKERTLCCRPLAHLQQSVTILLPMRRVATLYGRIDALYLNAGRQFFGECAVHHGHIAQIAIMTSLPRELFLLLCMCCRLIILAASFPHIGWQLRRRHPQF